MIEAKEAYKQAVNNCNKMIEVQLKYVEEKIDIAINQGKFSFNYYQYLHPEVIKILKNYGYFIEILSDDYDKYEISWRIR